MRLIPDEGSSHERIALVGEAPGATESAQLRPFVGDAGRRLDEWTTFAGLRRDDLYITNTYPMQPPGNKLNLVPRGELAHWIDKLHDRLAKLTDPWLLVPTGATALRALTGHSKITSWRGSVLSYQDRAGRTIKVIPTLHPAFILRKPAFERRCRRDWLRIAKDATFRELRLPSREHMIRPTLDDVRWFLREVASRGEPLAIDIETPRSLTLVEQPPTKKGTPRKPKRVKGDRRIVCLAFSQDPSFSLTIPTTVSYWRDQEIVDQVWDLVRALCATPCPKVFHNGLFDTWWLARYGVTVANWQLDTLAAHHALDAADSHSLAYLASIDSRQPFWKCLLPDVEVLTPTGWRRLDSIVSKTTIMAHQNGLLQWESATPVKHDFDGVGLRIKNLRHDTWYTPNHRLYVAGPYGVSSTFVEAKDAPRLNTLIVAGQFGGRCTYPLIRLVAALQADGHINKKWGFLTWMFTKQRKVERLTRLLVEARIPFRIGPSGPHTRIYVSKKDGAPLWAKLGPNKEWGPWLLELDTEALDALIREVQHWDGWKTHNGHAINYSTKSRNNADWIATIGHLRGYAAKVQPLQGGRYWKVSLKARSIVSTRTRHWSSEVYTGPVYCVNVPSGAFLARSNGYIFVTGNSMKDAKESDDDEGAEFDSASDAVTAYHIYNGLDAAVTRELIDVYEARLKEANLRDFYDHHYRDMFMPLLALMQHGVRMDEDRRADGHRELTDACATLRTRLTELAGTKLHAAKGESPKKVAAFLYDTLKLPRRTLKGRATTREVALRDLIVKYPDKATEPCSLILEWRAKKKQSELLAEHVTDADFRMRSSYRFTTETGRLSSSKNPFGTGRNAQNVDRTLRRVFVPDEGCVFVEVDASQAESRVVRVRAGALTGDQRMIEIARSKPWEFDDHTNTASVIFGKPADQITKLERFLGKQTNHAGNYGEQGKTFSENLLKLTEGEVVRTPEECQRMLDAHMLANPAIPLWQRSIRAEVLANRRLVNSWGRVLDMRFDRFDDDLYRRGYAYKPQSDVGDLLNQWGLVPLHAFLAEHALRSRINCQVHDSLLVSCPPDEAWLVYDFLRRSLERPRSYDGVELVIPVEVKIGRTWESDTTWKKPPERDEFEAAVRRLTDG